MTDVSFRSAAVACGIEVRNFSTHDLWAKYQLHSTALIMVDLQKIGQYRNVGVIPVAGPLSTVMRCRIPSLLRGLMSCC